MNTTENKISAAGEAEPKTGVATVPVWLIMLFGALVYWGQLYLSDHAGGFDSGVYAPYTSIEEVHNILPKSAEGDFLDKGKKVFNQICIACHQQTGLGLPGQFPPLAGSEWVLAPSPNRIGRIVLEGFAGPVTVKGQQFNSAMTPWKDNLTDEQVAAVLSYVRNQWDNKAPYIKTEQIKAIRAETKDRNIPWTAEELQQIPVQ